MQRQLVCTIIAALFFSFLTSNAGELGDLYPDLAQDEDFLRVRLIVGDPRPIILAEDDYLDCLQEIVWPIAGTFDDPDKTQHALYNTCISVAKKYDSPSKKVESEKMMKVRFKVETAVEFLMMSQSELNSTVDGIINMVLKLKSRKKTNSQHYNKLVYTCCTSS